MTRDYLLPSHLPIHDRPKTQKKSLSSAALSSNLKKARLFTSDSSEICCLYVCWHWIYCANAESQRTSTPAEVHIPDLLLLYSCRGWTARCNKLQGHNKLRSIILLPMQDCQVPHMISSQAFCKGLSEDFFPVNKKGKSTSNTQESINIVSQAKWNLTPSQGSIQLEFWWCPCLPFPFWL